MEDKIIKGAVILSILSSPSRSGVTEIKNNPPEEITGMLRRSGLKTQDIIESRYSSDPFEASDMIIERCIKSNIKIITLWDSEYPGLLREIHNPPVVLYTSGTIHDKRMAAIVGTRESDEKSEEFTRRIASNAVFSGYTVVSGMALGIDREAHIGSLEAGGGTIAVLPGGIDIIYPRSNSDVYRMIIESPVSAVVSEYPPGVGSAQKWTFARRNRLISGLSEAVIVVQAPLKSGAMITARYAIEQNRDLYACPGNAFDERYGGCNELIRQGAGIFSEMKDLFPVSNNLHELLNDRDYGRNKNVRAEMTGTVKEKETDSRDEIPPVFTTQIEESIWSELKSGGLEIDSFLRRNGFSPDEMNRAVTSMEIAGIAGRRGNKIYKL